MPKDETVTEITGGKQRAVVVYRVFDDNLDGLRVAQPYVRIKVVSGEWVTIDLNLLNPENFEDGE